VTRPLERARYTRDWKPMPVNVERVSALFAAALALAGCASGGSGATAGGACVASGHSCLVSEGSTCCPGLECSALAGVCLVEQGNGTVNGNSSGSSSGSSTGTQGATTSGQVTSSSSSSGGACLGYGTFCQDAGVCCSGFVCDDASSVCLVAAGYDCEQTGEQCASPNTCNLGTGLCGNGSCQGYGDSCATGACCGGLSCDATRGHLCFVGDQQSCVADAGALETCTWPDSCGIFGTCMNPDAGADGGGCQAYGQSCASAACCSGLACDGTLADDVCYLAYDSFCDGGSETCAWPYSCGVDGYCTTGEDGGYDGGCQGYGDSCFGASCCTGLSCDATRGDLCFVADGWWCVADAGFLETCAWPDSCGIFGYCTNADAGVDGGG
jgi:hypothetical protein